MNAEHRTCTGVQQRSGGGKLGCAVVFQNLPRGYGERRVEHALHEEPPKQAAFRCRKTGPRVIVCASLSRLLVCKRTQSGNNQRQVDQPVAVSNGDRLRTAARAEEPSDHGEHPLDRLTAAAKRDADLLIGAATQCMLQDE